MKQISEKIFIGNDTDCAVYSQNKSFAVIHACKTCHQSALGYTKSLPQIHPNYLIYKNGQHLFLNLVDMANEFLPKYTHPIVASAMTFINDHIENKNILIHCNLGQSRSPSLGLIYLTRCGLFTNSSYDAAAKEFLKTYPDYAPGRGINLYMQNNWKTLIKV